MKEKKKFIRIDERIDKELAKLAIERQVPKEKVLDEILRAFFGRGV